MRNFNTEGICNRQKHYMVDPSAKITRIIEKYIRPGKYFSLNRGRQFGKTTTLGLLAERLHEEFYCLQISFEGEDGMFESEQHLADGLVDMIERELRLEHVSSELIDSWGRPINEEKPLRDLGSRITELNRECDRKIVLMIDETDRASDNRMMLRFLGMLREKYLQREKGRDCTFHSVILCGVYDIKNLRMKFRPDEEHRYNSPWNIAAEFDEDLSFSPTEIEEMLCTYECDHHTVMDIRAVSELIYDYTSGYPVLVSGICKRLDENIAGTAAFPDVSAAWTAEGIAEAVKIIEHTRAPLFEDMVKQIEDYPELKEALKSILFEGNAITFNAYNKSLNLAKMFDYIKSVDGRVAVSNRIFEVVLYDYFLSEEKLDNVTNRAAEMSRSQFIRGGNLDMEALLRKFAEHYAYVYVDNDQRFVEKYARKIFLMYLKPIINGTGNYYIEAQTRDAKRTDIVVDYHGRPFLIETKIWYGPEYNEEGEEQLCGYLERLNLRKGYLLTFSFNKNKETGVKEFTKGEKTLWEITV